MGCDYYICKDLVIYCDNRLNDFTISIEIDKGYFYDIDIDEDDPRYDKAVEQMEKDCLTPSMESIIVYENGLFKNVSIEKKYKDLIEIEMKKHNVIWDYIIKIVKKETRYERE
jgi:hypothetical protein